MFSSKSFIVFGLIFRSLIHLEFIFVFVSLALGDIPKKYCYKVMSKSVEPIFF